MQFFPIFCSLSLIFVIFPHFLQIFLIFFENILILKESFRISKTMHKTGFGKIRIFQKNIHPWVYLIKKSFLYYVSYQHDDDISICMIPEFSEPSLDILVGEMLGNVVDQESSHSSSVVRTGDSSVPLLACSVPDLGLDSLSINLYI